MASTTEVVQNSAELPQRTASVDLLDDVTSPTLQQETDESALLDSALLVEDDKEGEGDVDGEISLLDQEETKETIPIEDPVCILINTD